MKKHPQEKYLNLKSNKFEYFTYIGEHLYKRADGTEFKLMDLRKGYRFISTHKGTPFPHPKWEHNPATGFKVRSTYAN
jgi:hypothetical protein